MEQRKLPASERPTTFTQFTVTGTGEFPLDMLRYDACWPKTSFDVDAMVSGRTHRSVNLVSHRPGITAHRWASFGWVAS